VVFVAPVTASAASVYDMFPGQVRMFQEQVASQQMIGALLGTSYDYPSWVSSITFGHVQKGIYTTIIPVTVNTRANGSVSGTLVLRTYNHRWYFYSITRGPRTGGISTVSLPVSFNSSVVRTAIDEQTTHQSMLYGIVTGGYKRLTVLHHNANAGTRWIDVKLSGGTRSTAYARVTAYGKIDSSDGRCCWFLSTIK